MIIDATSIAARTTIPPLSVLTACGWLPEAELQDARLRVQTLSRAYRVDRVTRADGHSAIVKQLTDAGAREGRSLAPELRVYRLARGLPQLAGLLPAVYALDEARHVLACASLSSAAEWPADSSTNCLRTPDIARGLGIAMATWQRATWKLPMHPSRGSGVLALTTHLEDCQHNRSAAVCDLMRRIVDSHVLRETLLACTAGYQTLCLIHGDIRHDNWIEAGDAPRRVHVIDWEMSGAGDPAWDVASVLAELELDTLRGMRGTAMLNKHEARDAFFAGYASAAGPLDATSGDGLKRVRQCMCARLVHLATEWCDAYPKDGEAIDHLLACAHESATGELE